MIAEAARRLERFGARIDYLVADLGRPFALPGGRLADAILSTATFHWVADHGALFSHLAAVIRPGGRLVAQCGGTGNIASIQAVLATIGDGWQGDVHFEAPEETAVRLAAAGFDDIQTWLQPERTRFEPGEPFESYLRTVVLGSHLARLPEDEHDTFVHEVAEGIGDPLIAYVRLNIVATRT